MKYLKWLIWVCCLAILVTACGGKKLTAPDKPPTCEIESGDRAIRS